MVNLEHVNWSNISHQELDMMLLMTSQEPDGINKELTGDRVSALSLACEHKREDLVTILLLHGADVNKKGHRNWKRPLHFACMHKDGNVGLVRKLLQAGAAVDAQDLRDYTALHWACHWGNLPVAELLVQSGADVNLEQDKETALVKACFGKGHKEVVEFLLKNGADPNLNQSLAVDIAIKFGDIDALKALCSSGADLNAQDFISEAIQCHKLEAIKVLIAHGVDIESCGNVRGTTPLHEASLSHHCGSSFVQALLECGAQANVKDKFKRVPLDYALLCFHTAKIRILLAYGADANSIDFDFSFGDLFYSQRIRNCHLKIFKLMVFSGLKLNLQKLKAVGYRRLGRRRNGDSLKDLVDTYVLQPLSLNNICRIVIRLNMKSNIDENVSHLPLPVHVKDFLNFSDIWKEDTVVCQDQT